MLIESRTTGSLTWERRRYTRECRWNGTCRKCKAHHTALVVHTTETLTRSDRIKEVSRTSAAELPDGRKWRGIDCCGAPVAMKQVKGIRNDEIKCDSRCTSSKGHRCECSCGGKNHGAG
jgi:hypothetical protein